MNQLQHEQYRKVNQSEYPCSDHPKISLMRTESCAEGRSQTAEHPQNEYLRGISITLNASFNQVEQLKAVSTYAISCHLDTHEDEKVTKPSHIITGYLIGQRGSVFSQEQRGNLCVQCFNDHESKNCKA